MDTKKCSYTLKKFSELTGDEVYDILKARYDVFIVGRDYPCEEIGSRDRGAYHVFYKRDGELVAYLRVLDHGIPHIKMELELK